MPTRSSHRRRAVTVATKVLGFECVCDVVFSYFFLFQKFSNHQGAAGWVLGRHLPHDAPRVEAWPHAVCTRPPRRGLQSVELAIVLWVRACV